MPEAMTRASAALKREVGLPTDVNAQAASSAAGGVDNPPEPRLSPAAQAASAQAEVAQAAPPAPAPDGSAQKDAALAAEKERSAQLEAGNELLLSKITELAQNQIATPVKEPDPLPPLPENIKDLPADEQIELIAARKAREIVREEMTKERTALQQGIGPILSKVQEHEGVMAEQQIRDTFPRFDQNAHRLELDKLEKTMPGLSAIERAKIVADPADLMPAGAAVPVVEASLPSAATAAGMSGRRPEPQGPSQTDLLARAGELSRQGNRVAADVLLDQVLRGRVSLPSKRGAAWGR